MNATSAALDHLLRAVGDPVVELRDIGPGHPEHAYAQVIRAAAGVIAKTPEGLHAIEQAVRAVDVSNLSPRMRAHFAAAEAWLSGNPLLAAEGYALLLARWPHDLLALRLAQSCYFFLGADERMGAVVDAVMPAWKGAGDERGLGFVLAMASFAHAESGEAAYAEALGRQALAIDSACPFGVHAVAHAIAESGRPGLGAQWMREQRAQWAGESRMRTHNAWHLAMFDVEDGNIASAMGVLDGWLLPASKVSSLDACDATALQWRLAIEGVNDEDRWSKVSDAFEQRLTPGFWPYVDLHAAIAHAVAGKSERLQQLAESIAHCARRSDYAGLRARLVTQPGLRALDAWAKGRYGTAAMLLAELHPVLKHAGGSRVQLEIFASIEHEAVRRERTGAAAVYSRSAPQRGSSPLAIEGSSQQGESKWRREAPTTEPVFAERSSSA